MASKKAPQVSSAQLMYEKLLTIYMLFVGVFYLFVSFGRYSFSTLLSGTNATLWLLGIMVLGWAGEGVICLINGTTSRLKSFLKRLLSADQWLLIGLLLWELLSCIVNQSVTGGSYINANRYYLVESAVSVLVLFPLPYLMRRHFSWLKVTLHAFMTVVTLFMLWVLISVFTQNIIRLPGGQIGMTSTAHLVMACNYNTTGAYAAVLAMMAMALAVSSRKIWVRVVYTLSVVIHLAILYLSNSRTSYYSVVIAVGFLAFMVVWNKLKGKNTRLPIAIGCGILCSAVIFTTRFAFM